MNIKVNGNLRTVDDDSMLSDVLEGEGIDSQDTRGIAVARNDRLVRKSAWESTRLEDGDRLEIVTARQGG